MVFELKKFCYSNAFLNIKGAVFCGGRLCSLNSLLQAWN